MTLVEKHAGGLDGGHHATFGPDGHLYVASGATNSILRYHGESGSFLGEFVPSNSGGLNNPHGLRFGPDDNLYVTSKLGDQILRYDGATGVFLGVFADTRRHGIDQTVDVVFSPDGFMFVSGGRTHNVLRFEASTGAFIDEFVAPRTGGLRSANGLAVGSNGDLYVASTDTNNILRFSGDSGRFVEQFVTAGSGGMLRPRAITFGPNGQLFVASDRHAIHQFESENGAHIGDVVPPRLGGLELPVGIAFDDRRRLAVVSIARDEVKRYYPTADTRFEVNLSSALGVEKEFTYATVDGLAVGGDDYVPQSGNLHFEPFTASNTFTIRTIDDFIGEQDELFQVRLFDAASGESILAVDATIKSDDPWLAGDANLDGVVNFNDFLALAKNFGSVDAVWGDGDFNGDESVSFEDFLILAGNFGARV